MKADVGNDLILEGVGKSYGLTQVLQPTDLHVRSGEFLTIVGPSGSGKTTLLRIIAGFTDASRGNIRFRGEDLTAVPTHKRPFNTVFQDYALFPHMTVAENVGYGLMLRREPKDKARLKIDDALTTVGLQRLLDRYPSQLSGGQKQRVALARALVCDPQILLLDEPLSALDAEMRGQMQVFLKELQRRVHTTFILVTHDQEEAITMSDRIAVMSAGRIEQIGTHREVYYAPRTRFVAGFFGDNNLLDATLLPGNTVDCPLGRIPVAVVPGSSPGPVVVSLRPEAIVIEPARPNHDTEINNVGIVRLPATIRKVTFAGPLTRLVVSPDMNSALEMQVKLTSGHSSSALSIGQRVTLSFAAGDLALVPDGNPREASPTIPSGAARLEPARV